MRIKRHFIQTLALSLLYLLIQLPLSSFANAPSPADPKFLASKIKLIVLDVDGVLTNGSFTYDQNGDPQVNFHVHDFVGFMLGIKAGIQFAIISAGENPATTTLIQKLNIPLYYPKRIDKLTALEEILKKTGCTLSEVAFIGDDYVDEACMRKVALPMSVPNAMAEIKTIAKWISHRPGGEGAAREAIQFILEAQGKLNNIFNP